MTKTPHPPPGRETSVPDMNAGAPRPRRPAEADPTVPDMDSPPPVHRGDEAAYDRGTKESDREARVGTVPGPDDFDAEQKDDPTWHDTDDESPET